MGHVPREVAGGRQQVDGTGSAPASKRSSAGALQSEAEDPRMVGGRRGRRRRRADVGELGQADAPDLHGRGLAPVDQHQHRLGRVGPDQPREDGGRAAGRIGGPEAQASSTTRGRPLRAPGATIATPERRGMAPRDRHRQPMRTARARAFSPSADQARPDASGAAGSPSRPRPRDPAAQPVATAPLDQRRLGDRPRPTPRRGRRRTPRGRGAVVAQARQVDRVDVLVHAARRPAAGAGPTTTRLTRRDDVVPVPWFRRRPHQASQSRPLRHGGGSQVERTRGHTSLDLRRGDVPDRVGGAGEFVATTSTARPTRRARPPRRAGARPSTAPTTSTGSGVRRFRPTATGTFLPGATSRPPSSIRTDRASQGRRSTPISTPACAGVCWRPSRTATIGTCTSCPPPAAPTARARRGLDPARARPFGPVPSLQLPSGRRSGPPVDPAGQASASITRLAGQLEDQPRIGAPPRASPPAPTSPARQSDEPRAILSREKPGGIARAIVPPEEDDPGQPRSAHPLRMRKTNLLGPRDHVPRPLPCVPERSAATAARVPRVVQATLRWSIGPAAQNWSVISQESRKSVQPLTSSRRRTLLTAPRPQKTACRRVPGDS
jgi:hypothetical protein